MTVILKLFLEISVMASVMVGIVLFIRKAFSNKMNPAFMLILWGMVIMRLILPVTIASPVSFADLIQQQNTDAEFSNDTFTATDNAIASIPENNEATLIQPDTQATNHETGQEAAENITITATESTKATLRDILISIPIWSVLTAIWLVGAVSVLCLTIWKARRFRIKLNFCNPVADKRILETIQHYKKDVGIKRRIMIYECDFVQSPSVFGYFKPCILIPSHFVKEMDRSDLNAILLHEVYHIRCHDLLKNYIWMVAKALHWFNPLVWIAYKKFEDDIELCRDHKVALRLDKDGTLVYSQSLVKAARFCKHSKVCIPPMATSLFASKCKLKDRVVRLVKPQRKTKTSAMVTALLALLMLITCFTTACQPTPEEDVVIGKDEGLSDLIQSTPDTSGGVSTSGTATQANDALYKKLSAPKHWNLETTALGDKLNITADVDIELPGVSQLPAATASLSEFTQEDLDKIADVLGVKEGAVWTEIGVRTKEQIEEDLIRDRALIAEQKAKDNPDAAMIKKAEETIEYNQQLYNDAPSESELENIEFKISQLTSDGDDIFGIGFRGITQVDGNTFFFSADNSFSGDRVNRIFANFGTGPNGFGGVDIDKPYGVSLTKEQAAEQATEIAEQLTEGLSICYITPAATSGDESRNWGWACVFMREINGCPTAYETTEIGHSLDAVSAPVDYEKMIIVIDDMGMVCFEWEVPMTIESIDNPDVPLLSFDEISQRAIEQIEQRLADKVSEDIDDRTGIDWGDPGCTANIKKVKLGLMRVAKANSNDFYYMPVWKFFVDLEHTDEYYKRTGSEPLDDDYVDEDGNTNNINGEYSLGWGLNVITINALDGSTIDSDLGY